MRYMIAIGLTLCLLWAGQAVAQSLMPGATPSNFSVPAGWSVHSTQTFEADLGTVAGGTFAVSGAARTTTRAHSGTWSVGGLTNPSGSQTYGYEVFPSSELYISWWEWLDSTARFNTEMIDFHMLHNGPFEEFVWDWYYQIAFNRTTASMSAVMNGPHDQAIFGPSVTVPVGQWFQNEVYYKANTSGQTNGSSRYYLNGTLIKSVGPQDLNSTVNMANSRLSIGGSYTKLIWWHTLNPDVCGTFEGDGQVKPQPAAQCLDFNNCACPPNPPVFGRYFDDIIVLIPGSGGGVPPVDPVPGAPAFPTGLNVSWLLDQLDSAVNTITGWFLPSDAAAAEIQPTQFTAVWTNPNDATLSYEWRFSHFGLPDGTYLDLGIKPSVPATFTYTFTPVLPATPVIGRWGCLDGRGVNGGVKGPWLSEGPTGAVCASVAVGAVVMPPIVVPPVVVPPPLPRGLVLSRATTDTIVITAAKSDCAKIVTSTLGSTTKLLKRTVTCVN